jgi:hypothetical protein
LERSILSLIGLRPFRCESCDGRFLLGPLKKNPMDFSIARTGSNPKASLKVGRQSIDERPSQTEIASGDCREWHQKYSQATLMAKAEKTAKKPKRKTPEPKANGTGVLPMPALDSEHLDISALETWLWDAACAIRGATDAPKFKDFILPLIFFKRLSDVFDDEFAGQVKEFGDEEIAREVIKADHEDALKSGRRPVVRFFIPHQYRRVVCLNELRETDYNLSPSLFVDINNRTRHRVLGRILADLQLAQGELDRAFTKQLELVSDRRAEESRAANHKGWKVERRR